MASAFVLAYRVFQVPSALLIGNWVRNESLEAKEPTIISNISGVTCGILGSFVWPLVPVVYGYQEYQDYKGHQGYWDHKSYQKHPDKN